MSDLSVESRREARIAKLEREFVSVVDVLRDEKLPDTAALARHFVEETFAELRASLAENASLRASLEEGRKDAERLDAVLELGYVPFYIEEIRKAEGLRNKPGRDHIDLAIKRGVKR